MKKSTLLILIGFIFTAINVKAQELFLDIFKGEMGSNPNIFHQTSNAVFFTAMDEQFGQELWYTDGSVQNTIRLTDINPGTGNTIFFQPYIDTGYLLLFTSYNNKNMIWQTDGTIAGTFLRKTMKGDLPIVSRNQFIKFKNQYFYQDYDSINGYELWVTDLEWQNPRLFKTFSPNDFSQLLNLCVINDKLYFKAFDKVIDNRNYYSFYESDGTDSGTHQLPLPLETNYLAFWHNDSCLYYITKLGIEQNTLYQYNVKTKVLTKLFQDENETIQNSTNFQFKDKIYLQTRNSVSNFNAIWVIDMANSNIKKFALSDTTINSFYFERIFNVGPSGLTAIWSSKYGTEYWKMNEDGFGATFIMDINPGSNNSFVFSTPAFLNNRYYFIARNNQIGTDIWSSDGTATGTKLYYELVPQIELNHLIWLKDKFILMGFLNSWYGSELYKLDLINKISSPTSQDFKVYPNPVRKGAFLQIEQIETFNNIQLYDINGKCIKLEIVDGQVTIPENIASGNYVLCLQNQTDFTTIKLQIE